MQLVFNQYLTARTPDFAQDLRDAASSGYQAVEFFLDTVSGSLERGYGFARMSEDIKTSGLIAVCAGPIQWKPLQVDDEGSALLREDRLYLMSEIFKKLGAGLCEVIPFMVDELEDLNLYPKMLVKKELTDSLCSYLASYSYLHFALCPDADEHSLLPSILDAQEIICESQSRSLSLILDAGRLIPESLSEIEKLPLKMISLLRLGLDEDFNLEFMRILKRMGYQGAVSLSSTIMGQGDNLGDLAEAYELLHTCIRTVQ